MGQDRDDLVGALDDIEVVLDGVEALWHHHDSELLDVVSGRRPVIHMTLVRAPEYDTPTLAGFRTVWRPIGDGALTITLLSLTPRDQLSAFGQLAHSAIEPDEGDSVHGDR